MLMLLVCFIFSRVIPYLPAGRELWQAILCFQRYEVGKHRISSLIYTHKPWYVVNSQLSESFWALMEFKQPATAKSKNLPACLREENPLFRDRCFNCLAFLSFYYYTHILHSIFLLIIKHLENRTHAILIFAHPPHSLLSKCGIGA